MKKFLKSYYSEVFPALAVVWVFVIFVLMFGIFWFVCMKWVVVLVLGGYSEYSKISSFSWTFVC